MTQTHGRAILALARRAYGCCGSGTFSSEEFHVAQTHGQVISILAHRVHACICCCGHFGRPCVSSSSVLWRKGEFMLDRSYHSESLQ